MNFPERNLTDQYISSSYQNILQQYVTTSSHLYVLDGYGDAVFNIPTASLGQTVITSDMTSSMTVLSASHAEVINRVSSSYAVYAETASLSTTASYVAVAATTFFADIAENALSASVANSASYALSASYAPNQAAVITSGSSWNITSSNANSASVANSASYTLTASYALNVRNEGGGLETGSTYPFTASWALYVVNDSSGSISSSYAATSSYIELPFWINFSITAGTGIITSGDKGNYIVGTKTNLTNWFLVCGCTGSITIDIQKSNYDLFPSFTSITNGFYVTANNQQKNLGSTLNWNTTIEKGDILKFYVSGSSNLSSINLIIYGIKYV